MTHKLLLALLAAPTLGCSHTRVDPYAGLPAPSHVLRVPAQYNTIQAAVTAATLGDRILVSPGTYPGTVVITGPARNNLHPVP